VRARQPRGAVVRSATLGSREQHDRYGRADEQFVAKTLVGPYSLRGTGATVSTPIAWSEVGLTLDPRRYTLRTMRAASMLLETSRHHYEQAPYD
jgi:DNA primase